MRKPLRNIWYRSSLVDLASLLPRKIASAVGDESEGIARGKLEETLCISRLLSDAQPQAARLKHLGDVTVHSQMARLAPQSGVFWALNTYLLKGESSNFRVATIGSESSLNDSC